MIFPTVTGYALDGTAFTFPAGLEGEFNVLVVAFQQRQRVHVDMWMWHLRGLSSVYAQVQVYEVPTIQNLATLQNGFTDAWTRRGIHDAVAAHHTIPIYVEINDFNRALDIATVSTNYCFLIDREGEVLWRMQGGCDALKMRSLHKALERLKVRRPVFAS